ncbi:DoxX family protein [Corallococcus sp. EGB]|uniref:DoxX family protein n=1 Tax=Corallococcus sp. EGB TaxID=1521117 RepID=UPI001CC07DF5|nr:DoxX family protein [Corallococcus sp. EGB]
MNPPSPAVSAGAKSSKGLHVGLWIVQALLGITFVGSGLWKAFTPLPELAAMIPWAGQVPAAFLYFIAFVDVAGGLGVVLPSLTRIKPGLTVLAALGCALLQLSAIVFHFSRGEAANTPFNFFLVALSLFVSWGRRAGAPIKPRHA